MNPVEREVLREARRLADERKLPKEARKKFIQTALAAFREMMK